MSRLKLVSTPALPAMNTDGKRMQTSQQILLQGGKTIPGPGWRKSSNSHVLMCAVSHKLRRLSVFHDHDPLFSFEAQGLRGSFVRARLAALYRSLSPSQTSFSYQYTKAFKTQLGSDLQTQVQTPRVTQRIFNSIHSVAVSPCSHSLSDSSESNFKESSENFVMLIVLKYV